MAPANFKTYESQARLLAAVLASAPELKLNFKEIAKYYGESTPHGLEFQFRSVKSNARKLQEVALAGGNTATALDMTPSTPRKRKTTGSAAATPASKRGKKKTAPKVEMLSDDEYDQDADYDELDAKPSTSAQPPMPFAPASVLHTIWDANNRSESPNDGAARVSDNSAVDNEPVLEREADPLLSLHSLGGFDAAEDDGEC
ncbi:hypothetical protein MCOR25_006967 [Pyricularia grisea]|nr:hypothetical protein MCOR25_006967 [Pyricularia grisea]